MSLPVPVRVALTAAALVSACGAKTGLEIPDAPEQEILDAPGPDACTRFRVEEYGVDVLFVVDNSGSMEDEQELLIREIPGLVRTLASGDRNADGVPDFSAVTALHVGVVTSDMGSGDVLNVRTCRPGLGDDGILRRTARGPAGDCMPSYPSGTFAFMSGEDTAAFSRAVGCVANVGTEGCGFEQQLEAGLKAVTPTDPEVWTARGYIPPRFVDGTTGEPNRLSGHGSLANAGFLRPNSVFTLVLVTDEDDCSVSDYSLFDDGDPRFGGIPSILRCPLSSNDSTVVYPVSRYMDGFLGLRRSPQLLVFSAIAGIPPDTERAASAYDFDAVLRHPDMQPWTDVNRPSCRTARGEAAPPIRIVQTAAQLRARGANVAVTSICTSSFAPAFDTLINRIVVATESCD